MPQRSNNRMQKRSDLPSKVCLTCTRPFTWRKKWERDWENVKYCSDRCRQVVRPRYEDQHLLV
ncbi:MAG: DUF2256 domain-containing protein [Betaproteobacteria bacterium]